MSTSVLFMALLHFSLLKPSYQAPDTAPHFSAFGRFFPKLSEVSRVEISLNLGMAYNRIWRLNADLHQVVTLVVSNTVWAVSPPVLIQIT